MHQGLSFLPKNQCDVRIVEFAKVYRLTNNSIEPISFTVPRIKTEFFQDDLFPPTRVTWQEAMTSSEWFAQRDKKPLRISLQPEDMTALTSVIAPASSVPAQSFGTDNVAASQMSPEYAKSKQEALKKSVSDRVKVNYELEQNTMEGVEEKEWDE